jgi:hypothetical protein
MRRFGRHEGPVPGRKQARLDRTELEQYQIAVARILNQRRIERTQLSLRTLQPLQKILAVENQQPADAPQSVAQPGL